MIAIRTSKTAARLSRRAFLARVGGSAALLPLLQVERALGASGVAKRVITIAWTNGIPSSTFWPADDSPVSSEVLRPLTPVAAKVLGPIGLDLKVMLDAGRKFDGHSAYQTLFTGTYARVDGKNAATGPSIDQYVSDQIAKQVNLPLPIMNVTPVLGAASYGRTGIRNTPENNPVRLFNTAFASQSQPADQVAAVHARRKSVIDYLNRELGGFGTRLGTEDRAKIGAHLEAVRQLERQLAAEGARMCGKVDAPSASSDYPVRLKAFLDLAALAIRCDLTRAVAITFGHDGGGPPFSFPFLGIDADYHAIAHQGAAGYASKTKIDAWYFSQVAYLAKLLDDTPEIGGSALDHSVLVTATDMDEGSHHYNGRIPFLLIGGGGYFKTGRSLKLGAWAGKTGEYWKADSGVPHNKLLASVCHALDLPVDGFGSTYAGTLPELRG